MNFERSLSIKGDIEEVVNKETRKTAFTILKGVVLETPVDTGRARGNWLASVNNTILDAVKNKVPSASAAIKAGSDKIKTATSMKYPTIYIQNNLPYIERLNEGYSAQAPAKFVDAVIKRASR